MTISVPNQLVYSSDGDGAISQFSYPVRILEAGELVVLRRENDVDTTLALNTDYTLSGIGDAGGVTITMLSVPIAGQKIVRYRATAPKQIVDLKDKQTNPAEAVEQQLDRLAMVGQDHDQRISEYEDRIDDLDTSVAAAAASATAAGTSETNAAASATAAVGSASAASTSADAAAASAAEAGATLAGATMNTDTDVSANAWVLDEDDMASDSATKVPTQQSVKAKIDNDTILKVADRTALKALDTTKHTTAYLREGVPALFGRFGTFAFGASDLSAEVSADTQEGIYIAPDSDPTGASGAWVRQFNGALNAEWFGCGEGDDIAETCTVVNALLTNGGILDFIGGRTLSEPVTFNKGGIFIRSVEGDVVTSSNGNPTTAKGVITADSTGFADGGTMFTWVADDVGTLIQGGGMLDVELNGNSVATTGCRFDTTTNCRFRGKASRFTTAGVVLTSRNGINDDTTSIFSIRNYIERLWFVWGTAAACQGAHGLFIEGDGADIPTTQQYIGDLRGLVYNGFMAYISDTDNCEGVAVRAAVQSGGTGGAIRMKAGGTHAYAARKNTFLYVNGKIVEDDGCFGNDYGRYDSEAGGISASDNTYSAEIRDYGTGATFKTPFYKLRDRLRLPLQLTAAATQAAPGLANLYGGIQFADASTQRAACAIRSPVDWNDGYIDSVELTLASPVTGTASGDVRFTVELSSKQADGSANFASAAGATETKTLTMPTTANRASIFTFDFSSTPLSFAKGDILAVRVNRIGADATDTFADVVFLLDASANFRGKGPPTAGSGTYTIPPFG